MTERYAAGNLAVHELWNWYKRAVAAEAVPPSPWYWDRFDDGVAIPRAARTLYRGRADLMAAFDDPYATSGRNFRGWLAEHAPEVLR